MQMSNAPRARGTVTSFSEYYAMKTLKYRKIVLRVIIILFFYFIFYDRAELLLLVFIAFSLLNVSREHCKV